MKPFLAILVIVFWIEVGAAPPSITPTFTETLLTKTETETITRTVERSVTLPTPTVTLTQSDDVDCEGIDPTWFERECILHVTNGTLAYCSQQLFGTHTSEGQGTITAADEDHAKAPHNLLILFGTFAFGALVRFVCLDTKIPFTVVMFLLGCGFGAIGKVAGTDSTWDTYMGLADMNPHLIMYAFLPVLIFESAFAMEIPVFKKVVGPCILLAGPGLMIASVLTGTVAKVFFTKYEWTMEACLLFGTILSATDPVAVVALLKELGASKLTSTMIEGESLFNDGTAIVFFNVLIGAVKRKSCDVDWSSCTDQCYCPEFECELKDSILSIVWNFLYVALGGPVIGLVIAFITVKSLERVFNDTLIEVTLTLTSSYITFFVCEAFAKVSGVLGLVALGCYLSYFRHCISPEVEHTLHHFWEVAVFLTNSCIFALAGMIVALKAFNNLEGMDAVYLVITYATINIVRGLVCGAFCYAMNMCRPASKLSGGTIALVAWGGLRGAVGLSLALVLQNDTEVVQPNVRDKVVFHTAGIVILTLLVNGTTTQKLVSYFELNAVELRRRRMMKEKFEQIRDVSNNEIYELRKEPLYYDCNWKNVGNITDLGEDLEETYIDPYNHKGNLRELDAFSHQEALEAGRIAYLNTAVSSIHTQYAGGAIAAVSARRLSEIVQAAYELNPDTLSAESPGYLEANSLDAIMVAPKFNWFRRKTWIKSSFEIAVGYLMIHRYAQQKIPLLAEPSVAKVIVAHSKKTSTDTVNKLSNMIRNDPSLAGYARAVRTRHASRSTLNNMRSEVGALLKEGRIDEGDKLLLVKGIEKQMKKIEKKFPDKMELPSTDEILELTSWFSGCEPEAQRALREMASEPGALQTWNADLKSSFMRIKSKELNRPTDKSWACPGLFIVATGVVQIRLGRKLFAYGCGYTLGLQSLLTSPHKGSERFSETFTETECTMLFLDAKKLAQLLNDFSSLASELWRANGIDVTRMLMGIDSTYNLWDKKRISKTARGGYVEYVLDASRGDEWGACKRIKMPENAIAVLIKGQVWEYQEEDTLRFPQLLPPGFKYGSFSNHAIVFLVDESVWGSVHTRALQRWGRMKSKIRSIALWSGLRGEEYARTSLSKAFDRSPPPSKELLAPDNTELPQLQLPQALEPKAAPEYVNAPVPPVVKQIEWDRPQPQPQSQQQHQKQDNETQWRETWDTTYNRPYFWNKETGVRCWREPQELKDFKLKTNTATSSAATTNEKEKRRIVAKEPEQESITKDDMKQIIREELQRATAAGRGRGQPVVPSSPYTANQSYPSIVPRLQQPTYNPLYGSSRQLETNGATNGNHIPLNSSPQKGLHHVRQ
eukprot:TRINITY_DN2814_c0_g1_i1.p1 TRINITY_DN2814_c0_g1~~TRINITY_DN2814_c0_g1_i1.p1  ORF type:complete len:1339 (+),score=299.79 TRINITY_DN2814_c0_g1_i1:155-4171(+)